MDRLEVFQAGKLDTLRLATASPAARARIQLTKLRLRPRVVERNGVTTSGHSQTYVAGIARQRSHTFSTTRLPASTHAFRLGMQGYSGSTACAPASVRCRYSGKPQRSSAKSSQCSGGCGAISEIRPLATRRCLALLSYDIVKF